MPSGDVDAPSRPSLSRLRSTIASNSMAASALSRVLILPLTGLMSILLARVVSNGFGIEGYAVFSIVAAIPMLIPAIDLGFSAMVTTAAAGLPSREAEFIGVIQTCRWWLFVVSACLVTGVWSIAAGGLWPGIVGLPGDEALNVGIAVALTFLFLSMPFTVGYATLIGLRRNPMAIFLQGIVPIISGVCVMLSALLIENLAWCVALCTVGLFVIGTLAYRVGLRGSGVRLTPSLFRLKSRIPIRKLVQTAGPMLVIMITLPIAMQGGRLILSWTGSADDVAEYSAAMIAFLPVFSVAQMAGRSLWGDYVRDRLFHRPSSGRFVGGLISGMLLGTAGLLSLVALGPVVSELALGNLVDVPFSMYIILGAVVVVQAVHLPSGMYLTDRSGLRLQSLTSLCTAFVVTGITFGLSPVMGSLAPAIALLSGMVLVQFLPCFVVAARRVHRRDQWVEYAQF